jgi:hypothetical protein
MVGFACLLALVSFFAVTERNRVDAQESADDFVVSEMIDAMNAQLAAEGQDFRIEQAELLLHSDGWEHATTLITSDRTHRLSSQFVERDPRRGGFADISYLVDQSQGVALTQVIGPSGPVVSILPNAVTEAAIDRSMLLWQNEPRCPGPAVTKIADDGSDPDVVDAILTNTPSLFGTPRADITHAGWVAPAFFNLVAPGGSQFIIGVTFTLIFIDGAGNPTDINNDHRADTAFREIYYNLAFAWSADPANPVAIHLDSAITHEAGHGFGLGHFGKVFVSNKGDLKFAPRAIMNGVYVSPFGQLTGSDNASFCSIWANRK